MTIRPDLSQRIEHEIEMLTPEPIGHINYEGILHRGLPVFGTIGEVWLLRADGSLWRVDSDFGVPLAPCPSACARWLLSLAPSALPVVAGDAAIASCCSGGLQRLPRPRTHPAELGRWSGPVLRLLRRAGVAFHRPVTS